MKFGLYLQLKQTTKKSESSKYFDIIYFDDSFTEMAALQELELCDNSAFLD